MVYWRASERRRSREEAGIEGAISEGRDQAQRLLSPAEPAQDPFDQT